MRTLKRLLILSGLLCYAWSAFAVAGEGFPERPIELVIPFEPGSGTDVTGRLVAELAQEHLGTRIVITNKPGGSGATGYAFVKNGKADGYLIGMANSTLVSHKVFGNLPFDHNDVEVILLIHTSPSVLCVPAKSPYTSLEEVIEDARRRPGEISWAASSGNQLTGSLDFFHHAGTEFKVVPFGGGGMQPTIQTSGGHIDMCFTNIVEAKAQIEAGLLRPLAVYGKKRMDIMPDIPTFEELGYPVRCPIIRMIMAPPGTPRERLEVINAAFQKAVASQKYRDFVASSSGVVLDASFGDAMAILNEQREAFVEVEKQK